MKLHLQGILIIVFRVSFCFRGILKRVLFVKEVKLGCGVL